jgi:hypothetical protein
MVSFVPYLGAFVGVSSAILATLVQHGDLLHVDSCSPSSRSARPWKASYWCPGWWRSHRPASGGGDLRDHGRRTAVRLPRSAAGAAGGGVSMVLLRHAHDHYRRSGLYGAEADGDPEAVAEEAELEAEARELPEPPDGSATQDPPAPYPEP